MSSPIPTYFVSFDVQVKRSALKYVANNRIQELAAPRPLNEEAILDMNYDPYTKLLNAKKYVGTVHFICVNFNAKYNHNHKYEVCSFYTLNLIIFFYLFLTQNMI